MPPARPRVLAVLPGLIPSTILTVVKPLSGLHRAGRIVADIGLEPWVSLRRLRRADVVVFSRNLEPLHGGVLETALALGKPVIYDLDDNFFELPRSYESARHHRAPERIAQLERYLATAALVRVYSEPLRERAERLNPRVVRVDAAIDWSLVPEPPPPRAPDRVRIVYATSRRLEDELARLFLEDAVRVLDVYPDRVELHFWGYHPPELRGRDRVYFLDFDRDYDRFFRRFARSGFDVGLAPLRNEAFYLSKSDNKFREYAACRIAGVYSKVPVYAACVEDGRTGLLVPDTPGSWFAALAQLVEDPGLRREIQERAHDYARRRYGLAQVQEVWFEQLRLVLTSPQPPVPDPERAGGVPPAAGAPARLRARLSPIVRRGVRLLGSSVRTRAITARLRWLREQVSALAALLRMRRELRRGRVDARRRAGPTAPP